MPDKKYDSEAGLVVPVKLHAELVTYLEDINTEESHELATALRICKQVHVTLKLKEGI